MKQTRILFILSVLVFMGSVGGTRLFSTLSAEPLDSHPIDISIKQKSPGKYELEMFLPKDFGFQMEAPHRIFLSGNDGLKVLNADLKLKGPVHPKKPEYFEYVKPLTFQVEGKGKLQLDAKLFYCNFVKNICIPAKVNKSFSI
ncbi:hypothetical protein ND861_07880 [Leptospira sp. 2 VSF19]|uniref:Thiol:disulfide interchange protein DsbD N-terminal domain-containing protein n=1 Tax=Leptospira soteropolitanensis TaxID=2950025 RepID=A0AAW5VCX6_9LEPT|nr:hypothetical protein [Leptospira soteropolitanensis]MCW7492913.1 hypothetical protein [Leptospira soteropolitanensis]MCW7500148.1 hypothetical protein [Leptospira soteropolitanensis]MCW7522399.1 hypothetical protein [Leptospira soteropolitanensis]MCW7526255.1 hypothetical protein [Leptospira soteropolitanensis]MCW7529633.1 hypothetical protein [Leptospira soteropolitanensis]